MIYDIRVRPMIGNRRELQVNHVVVYEGDSPELDSVINRLNHALDLQVQNLELLLKEEPLLVEWVNAHPTIENVDLFCGRKSLILQDYLPSKKRK